MKYCNKCQMKIAGDRKYCPLCHSNLKGEGNADEEIFPYVHTVYYEHYFFFKLIIAASILGGLTCMVINRLISGHLTWSLIVIAGIGCMWLSLLLIINKRKNISTCMIYQVIAVTILVIPWDYFTGWHGWSIDFVIPILCMALTIAIVILATVTKKTLEDQLWYIFLSALFGIIPLIFIVGDKLEFVIPSYFCVSTSVLSLVLIILFQGPNITAEIKRRMHI